MDSFQGCDWPPTRAYEMELWVRGAVGEWPWCGSRRVVFGFVVVRGGRVLGEVEFFRFWLLAHVLVGGERVAGRKEKKVY